MPWESFASRFHVADLLRARPLEAIRQLFRAGSRLRVSNPEQVVQPEQARLSRDGVRMRY